ncbi:MAG: 2-C-methyl-D-erythritol 4-phosphate cytidylyltransferase [bacterium]|nr:2-C-methyl-D-erythritol 4-phosphate cytidylyltransferase [bacterium]
MTGWQCVAVVVAAGKSSRMGGGKNKALFSLRGRPVLSYSLEILQRCPAVVSVAVVGREEDRAEIEEVTQLWCAKAVGHFVRGGAERFESVRNGLEHFANAGVPAALIQDAARPFLEERYILDCLAALDHVPGCVVGVPLKDTLKETSPEAKVLATPDRQRFWLAQTPQVFRFEPLLLAYRALNPPPYPTDDGAVLEERGEPVQMIMGSYHNIKITNPEDIALVEAILGQRKDR